VQTEKRKKLYEGARRKLLRCRKKLFAFQFIPDGLGPAQ